MKTFVVGLACAAIISAQGPDWKSLSGSAKAIQNAVKNNVLRSAEKMPEDQYGFKPTPDVRSFGQLVGHIADANNNFCAAALGVPNPNPGIEKSKTTKADLVAALKGAMEFCDKAYEISDAQAAEIVQFRNQERSRLGLLQFNSFHTNLHYGNMVTYLRLKGIVPPSSDR
jgi:uncharacterized damage-inducible protein DinB